MQLSASLFLLGAVFTDVVHLVTVSASPYSRKELGQPNCAGQSETCQIETAQAQAEAVCKEYLGHRDSAAAQQAYASSLPLRNTRQKENALKFAAEFRNNAAEALQRHESLQEEIGQLRQQLAGELTKNHAEATSRVDEFMKDYLP
ncbi:hypothetical protein BC835DRAFT_1311751 [Cytidiella melzeri]|nr:hypothetical protein BC835DRAFT_1311751 [Cytidiella melzeri]